MYVLEISVFHLKCAGCLRSRNLNGERIRKEEKKQRNKNASYFFSLLVFNEHDVIFAFK